MAVFKSFSGILAKIDNFGTGVAGDARYYKLTSVHNSDGEASVNACSLV